MYFKREDKSSKGELENCTEALKFFGIAANHGLAAAQYNLGQLYESGWCVSTDPDEARKWYRKAADQGNRDAAWSLWYIYAYGVGVRRDPLRQRWRSLADVNGQGGGSERPSPFPR